MLDALTLETGLNEVYVINNDVTIIDKIVSVSVALTEVSKLNKIDHSNVSAA